jgi:hypothetical protein
MHSYVSGKTLIKKNVPLMEPSNWCRVYTSPTNKVISAHFLYKEQLFAGAGGSFKAMFKRFGVLEYNQFFMCPNKVSTLNIKQNLCIPKDNK